MKTSYNGWRNYETWLASLWLNENEYSQAFYYGVKEVSADCNEQMAYLRDQLEMQLRQEIETPCLWQDLLHAAFAQIDWRELVEAL